jgi:hypothetical protein
MTLPELPCHNRGDATADEGILNLGLEAMQTVVSMDSWDGDMDLSVDIGDEVVERIAGRAAELVARQQDETASDGWLRGADRIAAYIDAPRSRVYGLVSARRIPVHHDGSALIARRTELDAWLLAGGGKRS